MRTVLVVQPGAGHSADEELGAVGGRPRVGHAQQTGHIVLEVEVLVLKGGAVDGLAPCAIPCREVTALCIDTRPQSSG